MQHASIYHPYSGLYCPGCHAPVASFFDQQSEHDAASEQGQPTPATVPDLAALRANPAFRGETTRLKNKMRAAKKAAAAHAKALKAAHKQWLENNAANIEALKQSKATAMAAFKASAEAKENRRAYAAYNLGYALFKKKYTLAYHQMAELFGRLRLRRRRRYGSLASLKYIFGVRI